MDKIGNIILAAAAVMIFFCGCSSSGKKTSAGDGFLTKPFPNPSAAPSAYTEPEDILKYQAEHFWDKFVSEYKDYPTDSTMILGVRNDEVEYAVGVYTTLLESGLQLKDAQQSVKIFFDQIESLEAEDPSSDTFERIVEFVKKYFYDPNSPVRSEDLYLPFVDRLSRSKYVDPDMIPAYSYDAAMCSLNQVGHKAADFSYTDLSGKVKSLYKIKADYILLFFSNPGCPSCKDIIEVLQEDINVQHLIEDGRLAVVNIYIDQDIDEWKSYASIYPKTWSNGYDHKYQIRTNSSYNVRAIPSLYLLDSSKTVIMRDAPQERVIGYLDAIERNY